jgi:hypothetical protein
VTRVRFAVVALLLMMALPAGADMDTVVLRGNYWRDRNTRVLQPEAMLSKELSTGTILTAHYLLDAITSASVAAGVLRDQPFTELRNETGFGIGQWIGPALLNASYAYSSESDYWAHTASLGLLLDLFQHNTQLSASVAYGNDRVALRMGPTLYNPVGGLQTVSAFATWTQTLLPTLGMTAGYEVGVVGFGTAQNGWQANPYRTVSLGGAPSRELVPYQRIRQAVTATLYWTLPVPSRVMPHLSFRGAYRIYWDDWGLLSHTPELRLYVPIGPIEWRVTGRWYTQNHVSFWSDNGVTPAYPQGVRGLHCSTCVRADSRAGLWYTSDPKLGNMTSEFLELRLLVRLRGLRDVRWLPGAPWLAAGVVELSYGHYFNGGFAHTAYGDAEVAGLELEWPL